MNQASPTKPRRRWLRFSIRALLVLVTLICILLGWLGREIYQHHQRRAMFSRIEVSGGDVFADLDAFHYGPTLTFSEQLLTWWYGSEVYLLQIDTVQLRDGNQDVLLSDLAALHTVETLTLENVAITDETVRVLQQMKSLKDLNIISHTITPGELSRLAAIPTFHDLRLGLDAANNANLAVVKPLASLSSLVLIEGPLTDEGLRSLQGTPNLAAIQLIFLSKITPDGIQELATLSKLESLELNSLPNSNANWKAVGQITSLKSLRVVGTGIDPFQASQKELSYLNTLTNLEVLDLPQVPFDDQTLKAVRSMGKLQKFRCLGPRVTDDGLVSLQGLVNLETLKLTHAKISIDGLEQLSQMPALQEVDLGKLDVTFNGKTVSPPATISSH